jgi:hypothetical protein
MDKQLKKKRGRPKGSLSDNPANKSLAGVRVTLSQYEAYKAASERTGQTFSAWVRSALDKVAKKA